MLAALIIVGIYVPREDAHRDIIPPATPDGDWALGEWVAEPRIRYGWIWDTGPWKSKSEHWDTPGCPDEPNSVVRVWWPPVVGLWIAILLGGGALLWRVNRPRSAPPAA